MLLFIGCVINGRVYHSVSVCRHDCKAVEREPAPTVGPRRNTSAFGYKRRLPSSQLVRKAPDEIKMDAFAAPTTDLHLPDDAHPVASAEPPSTVVDRTRTSVQECWEAMCGVEGNPLATAASKSVEVFKETFRNLEVRDPCWTETFRPPTKRTFPDKNARITGKLGNHTMGSASLSFIPSSAGESQNVS